MMSFCRSVFPGDETRPNPGAMGCLAAYKEKIARYPATLDTLMALFKGINEKTKNYPDVNLSGLRGYICELMADKQKKYFFGTLLPFLIDLALSYPKDEIKILRASTKEGVVTIPRRVILSIIANSFFCTFDENMRSAVNK